MTRNSAHHMPPYIMECCCSNKRMFDMNRENMRYTKAGRFSIYMWNVHVSYFMTPINIACSMFSYSYWFKQLFQCMHVEALMESQTLFPDKQKKKKNNNECIIHNGNEWWTKFVAMIHSLIISSMYVDCRLWNVHDALQCIAAMPEFGSSTNSAL